MKTKMNMNSDPSSTIVEPPGSRSPTPTPPPGDEKHYNDDQNKYQNKSSINHKYIYNQHIIPNQIYVNKQRKICNYNQRKICYYNQHKPRQYTNPMCAHQPKQKPYHGQLYYQKQRKQQSFHAIIQNQRSFNNQKEKPHHFTNYHQQYQNSYTYKNNAYQPGQKLQNAGYKIYQHQKHSRITQKQQSTQRVSQPISHPASRSTNRPRQQPIYHSSYRSNQYSNQRPPPPQPGSNQRQSSAPRRRPSPPPSRFDEYIRGPSDNEIHKRLLNLKPPKSVSKVVTLGRRVISIAKWSWQNVTRECISNYVKLENKHYTDTILKKVNSSENSCPNGIWSVFTKELQILSGELVMKYNVYKLHEKACELKQTANIFEDYCMRAGEESLISTTIYIKHEREEQIYIVIDKDKSSRYTMNGKACWIIPATIYHNGSKMYNVHIQIRTSTQIAYNDKKNKRYCGKTYFVEKYSLANTSITHAILAICDQINSYAHIRLSEYTFADFISEICIDQLSPGDKVTDKIIELLHNITEQFKNEGKFTIRRLWSEIENEIGNGKCSFQLHEDEMYCVYNKYTTEMDFRPWSGAGTTTFRFGKNYVYECCMHLCGMQFVAKDAIHYTFFIPTRFTENQNYHISIYVGMILKANKFISKADIHYARENDIFKSK